MSGIDSIQRRAWIAAVRHDTKAAYTSFDVLLRERRSRDAAMPCIRAQDEEAQEADAIVERRIRAHEHGRGIFHGGECCKPGDE